MLYCRPNYKRTPKLRAAGWNHLSCSICEDLDRKIAQKTITPEERNIFRKQLEWHRLFQGYVQQFQYLNLYV